LAAVLSPDAQARAARFRFDQERERYSVGRGALRAILGAYADRNPASLAFEYGPFGKPALSGLYGLAFNLSHSGRLAHSGDQAYLYPALYSLEAGWRLRAAWRPGPDGVRHRTYRRRSLIPHRAGSAKPR